MTHSIGPQSVHLPEKNELAQRLLRWCAKRRHSAFLFTNKDTEAERTLWAKDALALVRRVSPELEQRSIRRGALRQMSINGASEEDLIRFSKHSTLKMLNTYLGHGRLNIHHAKEQAKHFLWLA